MLILPDEASPKETLITGPVDGSPLGRLRWLSHLRKVPELQRDNAKLKPAVQIDGLSLSYITDAGRRTIFSGLCLSLRPGEIVGLMGPSGCGKTSLALALVGLLPENGRLSGRAELLGRRLDSLTEEQWLQIRGVEVGVVFQDPRAALDPLLVIGDQLRAVAARRQPGRSRETGELEEWLRQVGFADPRRILGAYPHELSGGECQRAYLAVSLYAFPKVLICDEITSALDPPLRAEVLHLLRRVAREHAVAILFISHQQAAVQFVADRVCCVVAGSGASDHKWDPVRGRSPEER